MRRERYVLILPVLVSFVVGLGFLLGSLFPRLPEPFYLLLALGAGAIIILVDRSARRRVTEPVNDERLLAIGERAAFLSFRFVTGIVMVLALTAAAVFPSPHPLRFIGVGAAVTIGLQAVVYVIAAAVMRSKS